MSSHRRRRRLFVAATTVAIICGAAAAAGCDRGTSSPTEPSEQATSSEAASTPELTSTSTQAATSSPGSASGAANTSTVAVPASNPLFPLMPGSQSVRQGFVNAGHRRLPHRRVYTITNVTKEVDGVRAVVAIDQDFDGGELAEQSLEILALDTEGNVLYLGSYTEAYEGGQYVNSTDAWLSGVKGGNSGILVPAHPQVGAPSFTQAVVPGEGAHTAKVVKVGQQKCVPFRCFADVVVLEEGGAELKYFAPGVGGILTQPLSGDPQETEELINVTALSEKGLAEISAEVLELDQHARTVAADVYGRSAPAQRAA